MRHVVRWLLRAIWGLRAFNAEVLRTPGPVLLISNHVSWVDWLFLGACLDEDWRFVTSSASAETSWLHRRIMINRRTFPVDTRSPYAAKHMAAFLNQGGRLVLFAEGRISVTGSLMKLYEGVGFLLHRTDAQVITVYLRGTERLPWVRQPGWTRWFPRVQIHCNRLIRPPRKSFTRTLEARRFYTQWLRDRLVEHQFEVEQKHGPRSILAAVAAQVRLRPRALVLEDIRMEPLSYRSLWMAVRLLSRQWKQRLPSSDERVGVLLPNVNAAPLVILSLWLAGKTPAILNYSVGKTVLLQCARLADIRCLITSREFLERMRIRPESFSEQGIEIHYLEEIRGGISAGRKLLAWVRGLARPASLSPDPRTEEAVILFTSGSEGLPKGVVLTHANLMANVRQILAVLDATDNERIFNALPIFHSFGLTIGTLLPLMRGLYQFLYPSPLHYRMVPAAIYDRNCTIVLSTNTFLNGYARRAHPYDFRSVRYLFAGAEKVQEQTFATWSQTFGVRILEGYGATECSPCLSVNTPQEPRVGTAGRFLPGTEYRLEPVEGVKEGGRLLVRGPQVMKGYLNPEANRRFQSLGGWYDTGDIVQVDEEGYVHILGRLKRFAKVSGEMVSLSAVEDALAGAFRHYGERCLVAVLSRPDADKGEVLVAVTNEPRLRPEEIRGRIRDQGFSNLCIPRELKVVREIPKLGSGKVDYRELGERLWNCGEGSGKPSTQQIHKEGEWRD